MKPTPPEATPLGDAAGEEHTPKTESDDIETLARITGQVARKLRDREKGEPFKRFSRRLTQSKRSWQKEHPDRLEEAELLFGFVGYLQSDWEVRHKKGNRRQVFLNLTEYAFTATHYVLSNSHNKEYLTELRRSLEEIAVAKIKSDFKSRGRQYSTAKVEEIARMNVGRFWSGFIGQAATYHIMRESGLEVSLSNPKKDAFDKGDLECVNPEEGQALDVQAKRKSKAKRTTIEVKETNVIHYPVVSAEIGEQEEIVASSGATADGPHLAEAVSSRAERQQRVVTAIEIHVHGKGCDPTTGVPTQETVKKCRRRLQELGIIPYSERQ